MNYTSSTFLLFFIAVFTLYYVARNKDTQVFILIGASLFFYAYESLQLLLVFLSSWFVTSSTAFAVRSSTLSARKKWYASCGVVANLVLLGFFKYKFLFLEPGHFNPAGHSAVGTWLILAPLPIGISFYTFHGISLLVDTFRKTATTGESRSMPHFFANTLLYLVFFPQLVAGPIIKAKEFYPQVKAKKIIEIDFDSVFKTLVTGYFLKTVIADNLSEQTFWIAYPYFQWKSPIDLIVLLYGYSFQIFADFAGYSLIAIGLAQLLGYKLPDNFNFPYLSSSLAEFWRKWHISLSSFLRDYLYIPLGGNKKGELRTYVNLLIVMFLGGLWHGAAWSFAVWGLWHGIGLALERPFSRSRFFLSNHIFIVAIRILAVFTFVTLGWLLFKLQNFSEAWLYLSKLFHNEQSGVSKGALLLIAIYGFPVIAYHLLSTLRDRLATTPKQVLYGVMLFLILTNPGPAKSFIYFQF